MTAEKIYKVIWSPNAQKRLRKMNKTIADDIAEKVEDYLSKTPYSGEPLKGKEWKGLWKFHYGDYRIIYEIFESKVLIEIFKVSNRKDSYKTMKY